MDSRDLLALFGATDYTFNLNMTDVTHEESLRCPELGGNCINWIAGHVLRTRQEVLRALEAEVVIEPDNIPLYLYGDEFTIRQALPVEEIVQKMAESMSRFKRGFVRISQEKLDEEWPQPFLGQKVTRGRMMGLYNFHESYHIGQIGILRRVFGMEGKIRIRTAAK